MFVFIFIFSTFIYSYHLFVAYFILVFWKNLNHIFKSFICIHPHLFIDLFFGLNVNLFTFPPSSAFIYSDFISCVPPGPPSRAKLKLEMMKTLTKSNKCEVLCSKHEVIWKFIFSVSDWMFCGEMHLGSCSWPQLFLPTGLLPKMFYETESRPWETDRESSVAL